ncbi:hypothetical protein SAMN05421508_109160 [Caenispirillum bisanense]|uniref:Uncharacterized protein n=1 Tax=Caenispirillum bisanense TaxID=414052 RepID=A0A286GW88_9PROT|nr:hypothetical protein SAMN05421508_109160 [Caenispirillum bisanense]
MAGSSPATTGGRGRCEGGRGRDEQVARVVGEGGGGGGALSSPPTPSVMRGLDPRIHGVTVAGRHRGAVIHGGRRGSRGWPDHVRPRQEGEGGGRAAAGVTSRWRASHPLCHARTRSAHPRRHRRRPPLRRRHPRQPSGEPWMAGSRPATTGGRGRGEGGRGRDEQVARVVGEGGGGGGAPPSPPTPSVMRGLDPRIHGVTVASRRCGAVIHGSRPGSRGWPDHVRPRQEGEGGGRATRQARCHPFTPRGGGSPPSSARGRAG